MTHGSLFSGIGGFELGAEMSGIETIWNCEIEPYQRKILKQHFTKTTIQYEDIRELTSPGYVDIISGGFPCQDISIAGRAKGIGGEKSGLWSEMGRIIGAVRPRYVIIENSPMLIKRGLGKILYDLSQIGYILEWQCLSASQFGYNHRRTRFYGIAYPCAQRCENYSSVFVEPQKVPLKKASRQNPAPMPFERFNRKSNYEHVRMDDGFSRELDKRRIEGCGNAVIPEIAHYLFECIKIFNKQNYERDNI